MRNESSIQREKIFTIRLDLGIKKIQKIIELHEAPKAHEFNMILDSYPAVTIETLIGLGVGTITGFLWFILIRRIWSSTEKFDRVKITFAFFLGIIALIADILIETGETNFLSQREVLVIAGPITEEITKAILVFITFSFFKKYTSNNIKRWAILAGLSFALLEGLFYIYTYFGSYPIFGLILISVQRISPVHPVATFLVVYGISSRKIQWMLTLPLLGVLIHIFNNDLAFQISSLITTDYLIVIMMVWGVFSVILVTFCYTQRDSFEP